MAVRKYTKAMHMHRLSVMVTRDDACSCCPATREFSPWIGAKERVELWKKSSPSEICLICRETVGLTGYGITLSGRAGARCPCNVLGKDEAKARTIQALKEYYSG